MENKKNEIMNENSASGKKKRKNVISGLIFKGIEIGLSTQKVLED